jgi:hypothetical protein
MIKQLIKNTKYGFYNLAVIINSKIFGCLIAFGILIAKCEAPHVHKYLLIKVKRGARYKSCKLRKG